MNKVFYKNRPQRKKDYDYDLPGAYFVTICIEGRRNLFGVVKGDSVELNKAGEIAKRCWSETPLHFKNVELSEFIVMPNHFHAIVCIYDGIDYEKVSVEKSVGQTYAFDSSEEKKKPVDNDGKPEQIQKMHKKLSIIIGSFKSAVTKEINRILPEINFAWQTSFYDHIVRNDKGMEYISDYIRLNPANWNEDLENELFLSQTSKMERVKMIKKHYDDLFQK